MRLYLAPLLSSLLWATLATAAPPPYNAHAIVDQDGESFVKLRFTRPLMVAGTDLRILSASSPVADEWEELARKNGNSPWTFISGASISDDVTTGAVVFSDSVRTTDQPRRFFKVENTSEYPGASTIALFGDSITDFNSSYAYDCVVGTGYAAGYRLRAGVPHPDRYSVTHLNPGGTGPLEVSMADTDLTVTLARENGSVTSTVTEVRAAVLAAYGDYFMVNDYGDGGASRAQAWPQSWFAPYSAINPTGTFSWLQAKMGQRFNLARRYHLFTGGSTFQSDPEGDWDFGYSGHTAQEVIANPGPLGDVEQANAELIVGCIGTNDIRLGASAEETRDRIVALWDRLTIDGKRFVWMEVPPSGFPALEIVVEATNALLKPIAEARNITLIPWNPEFVQDGAALEKYFPDKIHPNDLACFSEADLAQPYLDAHVQPLKPDYGNAADNAWLTSNPTMNGNSSGVAEGWFNRNPLQTTPSKDDGEVGENSWQRLETHQVGYYDLEFRSASTTLGWSIGDKVEGVAEFDCNPTEWDMKGVGIAIVFVGTQYGEISSMRVLERGNVDFNVGKAGKFTLRTVPAEIPHGTTSMYLSIRYTGQHGAFSFRNAGIRISTQQ